MGVVYLIRHGQASLRSSNYDQLSEKGELQARITGKSFRNRIEDIDRIELGSLQRHAQTLEHFTSKFRTTANKIVVPDWNEYNHKDIIQQYNPRYSSRMYLTFDIIKKMNPKRDFLLMMNKSMDRWMSGKYDDEYVESWKVFKNRCVNALHNLLESLMDEEVALVFTSGGVKSAIVQHLMNLPDNYFMELNTKFVNCGVTKIVQTKNGTFVSTFNDYAHLEKNRANITYI